MKLTITGQPCVCVDRYYDTIHADVESVFRTARVVFCRTTIVYVTQGKNGEFWAYICSSHRIYAIWRSSTLTVSFIHLDL